MFARFFKPLHFTPGLRSLIVAYGAVMSASAGFTLMSLVDAGVTHVPPWSLYDVWAVGAGAMSAAVALFLARHWMGGAGALGMARAAVGAIIVSVVAAVFAGMLAAPIYGAVAGPIMLVSAFVTNPLLAIAWAIVHFGAHFLIADWRKEKFEDEHGSQDRAVSRLSAISQANLYRH